MRPFGDVGTGDVSALLGLPERPNVLRRIDVGVTPVVRHGTTAIFDGWYPLANAIAVGRHITVGQVFELLVT